MTHDIEARIGDLFERTRIGDVGLDQQGFGWHVRAMARRQVVNQHHRVTETDEPARERTADEASAAGD